MYDIYLPCLGACLAQCLNVKALVGVIRECSLRGLEEAAGATLGRYLLSTLPVYSLATIGKVIPVSGADTVGEEAETVDKLLLFPLP